MARTRDFRLREDYFDANGAQQQRHVAAYETLEAAAAAQDRILASRPDRLVHVYYFRWIRRTHDVALSEIRRRK